MEKIVVTVIHNQVFLNNHYCIDIKKNIPRVYAVEDRTQVKCANQRKSLCSSIPSTEKTLGSLTLRKAVIQTELIKVRITPTTRRKTAFYPRLQCLQANFECHANFIRRMAIRDHT